MKNPDAKVPNGDLLAHGDAEAEAEARNCAERTSAVNGWALRAGVMVLVATPFLPLAGGTWLGDDYANLATIHDLAERHRLISGTLEYFGRAVSSEGRMYRPLMMTSIAGNLALTGPHYAGWFAINLLLHLLGAVLLMRLLERWLSLFGRPDRLLAALGALSYGWCPFAVEPLAFISARADLVVSAVTVAAILALPTRAHGHWRAALATSALLAAGLGFKESAALIPLQLGLLLALKPYRQTAALLAVAASALVCGGYFALKQSLMGATLAVYDPNADVMGEAWNQLFRGLASMPVWWQAALPWMGGSASVYALLAPISLAAALWLGLDRRSAVQGLVMLASLAAAAGYMLALLAMLGALAANGEGARNLLPPTLWLVIAIAVGSVALKPLWGRALMALVAALSATLLGPTLVDALAAQRQMAELQVALAGLAQKPGQSLVLIPDHDGRHVLGRNAQGGLAMPPVQAEVLFDRVIPTLPSEIETRRTQIAAGLLSRLASADFKRAERELDRQALLAFVLEPAERHEPTRIVCWDPLTLRLHTLRVPFPTTDRRWTIAVAEGYVASCGGQGGVRYVASA